MVVMGHVVAPFGVLGWIKVHSYAQTKEGLLEYPVWWLGSGENWRELRVAEGGAHGKSLIARLEGCADRVSAAALKGQQIAVPRSSLPKANEHEYYWVDLIGLAVVNLEDEELGTVSAVLETGANSVLQVRGTRERLIPFIGQVIREVDLKARRIRVDWGLDY